VAGTAAYSPYHFIRRFHQRHRHTPPQYLLRRRILKARWLLADTDLSLTKICAAVGFESLGSFSATFYRLVGFSPRAYRARQTACSQHPERFSPNCFQVLMGCGNRYSLVQQVRAGQNR
jgi:AraC-like DNA-binding protein